MPVAINPARRRLRGARPGSRGAAAFVSAILLAATLASCGGGESRGTTGVDAGGSSYAGGSDKAGHVHGLVVDDEGAVLVATHTGLWRAGPNERSARPIGGARPDLMGLSRSGRRLLASGHPELAAERSPHLGLVESLDGGATWATLSLDGAADFHALAVEGRLAYGYNGLDGWLLVSSDGGRRWRAARAQPGPVLSLAVRPGHPAEVAAATEEGIVVSRSSGASWRPVGASVTGLLAWTQQRGLFAADQRGRVLRVDGGKGPVPMGGVIPGAPAAFAASGDDLYLAAGDGRILRSTDGGRSWRARAEVPH